jgi:hypothetical protein
MSEIDFVHEVTVRPAFDRRAPEPSKNYGVHGVEFVFWCRDRDLPTAYVVFRLSSSWMLPQVYEWWATLRPPTWDDAQLEGMVLATHWIVPESMAGPGARECSDNPGMWCDGGAGYHDGDELARILLEGGTDALWPAMESRFRELVKPNLS